MKSALVQAAFNKTFCKIYSSTYDPPLLLARAKQEIPGCECRRKRMQKPPKTAAEVPRHRVTVVNTRVPEATSLLTCEFKDSYMQI